MGTGVRDSVSGVELPGHEADHSSVEVNEWNYTSAPQYAFMA